MKWREDRLTRTEGAMLVKVPGEGYVAGWREGKSSMELELDAQDRWATDC